MEMLHTLSRKLFENFLLHFYYSFILITQLNDIDTIFILNVSDVFALYIRLVQLWPSIKDLFQYFQREVSVFLCFVLYVLSTKSK